MDHLPTPLRFTVQKIEVWYERKDLKSLKAFRRNLQSSKLRNIRQTLQTQLNSDISIIQAEKPIKISAWKCLGSNARGFLAGIFRMCDVQCSLPMFSFQDVALPFEQTNHNSNSIKQPIQEEYETNNEHLLPEEQHERQHPPPSQNRTQGDHIQKDQTSSTLKSNNAQDRNEAIKTSVQRLVNCLITGRAVNFKARSVESLDVAMNSSQVSSLKSLHWLDDIVSCDDVDLLSSILREHVEKLSHSEILLLATCTTLQNSTLSVSISLLKTIIFIQVEKCESGLSRKAIEMLTMVFQTQPFEFCEFVIGQTFQKSMVDKNLIQIFKQLIGILSMRIPLSRILPRDEIKVPVLTENHIQCLQHLMSISHQITDDDIMTALRYCSKASSQLHGSKVFGKFLLLLISKYKGLSNAQQSCQLLSELVMNHTSFLKKKLQKALVT